MRQILLASLTRQTRGTQLLSMLLQEEYSLLRAGKPVQVTGLEMTIQELGTIFRTKIPVKIVLLNNEFLGMVRQWQELFFERRYSSTEMTNPDFQMIARGYSIEAGIVKQREELDAEILKMVNHQGPYLLEVRVEKEDNVFPMVPSGAAVSDIRLE